MKSKLLQFSLGSLFLATLTFGIGLVVGLRFNLDRSADRREISTLKTQVESLGELNKTDEREHGRRLSQLSKALDKQRQLETELSLEIERERSRQQELIKSHADELRRLQKNQRGRLIPVTPSPAAQIQEISLSPDD